MTAALKSYVVRFAVRDCYWLEFKAQSEAHAIAKAKALYDDEGEDSFYFEINDGGPEDWDAEEVQS